MTRRGARGRKLALFDLDGTLLHGASSERRFAWWLFASRHAGASQARAWAAHASRHVFRDGRDVLRRDKAYLAGLPVARVAALASEHVDEVLDGGGIDVRVREALDEHRGAGHSTVLLSGTLQPLADAYARRLGMGCAIASLAPVTGRRYARGAVLRHPYGSAKRKLADGLCSELGARRRDTVAYGDSIADRAVLEWAGEAVAVEPDGALASLASARGWRVLRHAPDKRSGPIRAHRDPARVDG